ncbi:MAG: DUF2306 domain-containing protein [Pseudomonadota bacterium]
MTWAEAFDWNYWVSTINGGAHFALALAALALGPVLFFRGKGSRFHRLAGYAFVLSMLTVNITALTQYDFSGGPNIFHFFALMSLSALLPGFYVLQRAVRLKSEALLATHARLMMWAYFGLAAAGLSQIGTRVLPQITGDFGTTLSIIGGSIGVASLLGFLTFGRASKALAKRYPFD